MYKGRKTKRKPTLFYFIFKFMEQIATSHQKQAESIEISLQNLSLFLDSYDQLLLEYKTKSDQIDSIVNLKKGSSLDDPNIVDQVNKLLSNYEGLEKKRGQEILNALSGMKQIEEELVEQRAQKLY